MVFEKTSSPNNSGKCMGTVYQMWWGKDYNYVYNIEGWLFNNFGTNEWIDDTFYESSGYWISTNWKRTTKEIWFESIERFEEVQKWNKIK